MKTKFLFASALSVAMTFVSCSKDTVLEEENSVNATLKVKSTRAADFTSIAEQIKGASRDFLYNPDAVKKNADRVLETYTEENRDKFSNAEVIAIFELEFGVKGEGLNELLVIAYENQEVLTQEGAREMLIDQLRELMGRTSASERGFFASMVKIFGGDDAHCSLQVLGHIADAMVSAALAAATSPTGVGAVVNGANMVGSVAAAVYVASNCD